MANKRGAALLREWRKKERVSQSDLAKALDIGAFMTVSRWERGVNRPRRDMASKLEYITQGKVPVASWDE